MKQTVMTLFVLAAVFGLAGGLVYTWVLDPVEAYDSAPHALLLEDKYVYLALIGDLYTYERDLARAEARLEEIGVGAGGAVVAGMLEDYLDAGGRPEDVRNLARLAEALGASGGVLNVFAVEPVASLEPTSTQPPQEATSPTAAPTMTPAPTFLLAEQTALCAEPGKPGTIMVWVRDVEGNGLSGVEVVASWSAGQDRFFTGLRPEKGKGYADFEMASQVEYDVTLADFRADTAKEVSSALVPGVCPTDTLALNWRLAFEQVP